MRAAFRKARSCAQDARPPMKRAILTATALATAPLLYSALIAATTPPDPYLRAWLGGAIIPGRLTTQPWRLATAPLLHLEWGHLLPNAAFIAALAFALAHHPTPHRVAPRPALTTGPAATILIAALSSLAAGLATALAARGWALGASGAMFGLLGAWTLIPRPSLNRATHAADPSAPTRTHPRWLTPALLLTAATWATLAPGDPIAHLAGLTTGTLTARLTPTIPRRATTTLLALTALLYLTALPLAARHATRSTTPPTTWTTRPIGAAPLTLPPDWTPGIPVPPCTTAATDGLLSICALPTTDPPTTRALLTATGHTLDPTPDAPRFPITARPPGTGHITVHRPHPHGPTLLIHALSPAALHHRAPIITAILKHSAPTPSPPPP